MSIHKNGVGYIDESDYVGMKNLEIAIAWEQHSAGGVDSYLAELINAWPSGHDHFTIFTNYGNAGVIRFLNLLNKESNINIKYIKSCFINRMQLSERLELKILRRILKPILFIFSILIYKRALGDRKYDVLIGQNGGYPAALGVLSAIFSAACVGIPVRVLVIHHQANKPPFLGGFFGGFLDSSLSSICTSLVAVSSATLNSIKMNTGLLHNERLFSLVIHNGVSNHLFDNKKINVDKKNKYIIGVVGRVEAYKGQYDVIYAISQLPLEIQDQCIIKIIGYIDLIERKNINFYIEQLGLEKYVQICGYVEGSISDAINSLDLLISATRTFEGFGLTILEAMQLGVPILVTNVGAVSEFVDDSCGVLVEPGQPMELAKQIENFIGNPRPWFSRADAAKNVGKKFSSEIMAINYRHHLVQQFIVNTIE